MSEPELEALDAETAGLLSELRDELEPDAGALARVGGRLGVTLGIPDPCAPSASPTAAPHTGTAGSEVVAPEAASQAGQLATQIGAIGFGRGALTFVALAAYAAGAGTVALVARRDPEVRVVERRVEVPVRVIERVEVLVERDASVTSVAFAPSLDAGTAAHVSDAGTYGVSEARDRGLASENALVSRAQAALARGRVGEALAAIAEHQRSYPRGQFVEEREALAVQALVRAGNLDAARARAERFRARYPRSMLRRAVDSAVGWTGP